MKLLPKLPAVFKMAASRTMLPRAKFFGCVAVSQLNSSRLSQLFGASFKKFASYVAYSKNCSSFSDTSAISVKISLVPNKYGVRNFSLQNWLSEYAILLFIRKVTNNACTRFMAYLHKRRIATRMRIHCPVFALCTCQKLGKGNLKENFIKPWQVWRMLLD